MATPSWYSISSTSHGSPLGRFFPVLAKNLLVRTHEPVMLRILEPPMERFRLRLRPA